MMKNNKIDKLIHDLEDEAHDKLLKIIKKIDTEKLENNFIKYGLPLAFENTQSKRKRGKRNFSNRQRKILLILSGNICCNCGSALNNKFHADHIMPFSKNGKTILNNGQALCAKCNLHKGSKYEKN